MNQQILSTKGNLQLFQQKTQIRPQTYFQLMGKVGDSGKYQTTIFILFSVVLFVSATMLLSTSFLFLNKQFQCFNKGLVTSNCKNIVCKLSKQQRLKYLIYQVDGLQSAAIQFGPYVCQDQIYLDLSSSSVYFGSFIGYLTLSSISDNYGRKTSLVLSMAIATFGSIIVSSSINIIMLSIGLIFCGIGINPSIGTIYLIFSQIVQDKYRQKYTIATNFAFTGGAIAITLFYLLIGKWRIIFILFTTIPIVFSLAAIIFYFQETPQFLFKKSNKQVLLALNRIGFINFKKKQIIQNQDIQNVRRILQIKQKVQNDNQKMTLSILKKNKNLNILDLFKYSSLRFTTIAACLLSYLNLSMYYGPMIIISKIGFNMFVSSFALSVSELLTYFAHEYQKIKNKIFLAYFYHEKQHYIKIQQLDFNKYLLVYIPSYLYIEDISRKKAGLIVFLTATISTGVLIFVQKPNKCDFCWESILELIIIFIYRSVTSFYYSLFSLYLVQLFPSSISGLGSGFASVAATLGSTSTPLILGSLQRVNFNVMILFCCYGALGMGISSLLKETKNKHIPAQIQQVKNQRQNIMLQRQII